MNRWRTALEHTGILAAVALAGCSPGPMPTTTTPVHSLGGITMVTPRCVEVRSCLLGQVVAAETSTPLARAAVFLEREPEGTDADVPLQIVRTTDEQGVFTVADAPAGRYSVSVYKGARRISASGLELGGPGTLMIPIRLPPPS